MMRDKQMHTWYPLVIALGMLVLAAVACATPTPTTEPGGATDVAVVQTEAEVRRYQPDVWAGAGDLAALPRLGDDAWHQLMAGDMVTTNEAGEGWVRISDCMLVYVFQNSGLIKSACPKSSYEGGNVTCAIEGTSVYNNSCAGQVRIQTLSAELLLEGTWLSVTYLPEMRLSLIAVFEGNVQARPVRNFDARTYAEAEPVPEGYFWFTTPGVQSDPVAGLTARTPHPLEELPPLLEELDLWPWWERTGERAQSDRVPFPEFGEATAPAVICRTSDDVALYEGPSTDYLIVARLLPGTQLLPVGRNRAGDWFQVEVVEAGEVGWIRPRTSAVSCSGEVDVPVVTPAFPPPEEEPTATPTRRRPTPTPTQRIITPPDLVVSQFGVTEGAQFNRQGQIQVALAVTVRNQGDRVADEFKVAVEYQGPSGTFLAPFTVAGQESPWYPYTRTPLEPGATVTFAGRITLSPDLAGETIRLWATADSCAGDELMPDYCRVQESDEDNNRSQTLNVGMPQAGAGGIVIYAGGGPFDDPRVREAILYAGPMADLATEISGDPNLSVTVSDFAETMSLDAREIGADPDLARQLMAEAGYPDGFGLILFVSSADEELLTLAKEMSGWLGQVGMDAQVTPTAPSDLSAKARTALAAGETVLWLSR